MRASPLASTCRVRAAAGLTSRRRGYVAAPARSRGQAGTSSGQTQPAAAPDTGERRTFRAFLREARANWCDLCVSAVAERLQVVGFRFAGADADAWAIWYKRISGYGGEVTEVLIVPA